MSPLAPYFTPEVREIQFALKVFQTSMLAIWVVIAAVELAALFETRHFWATDSPVQSSINFFRDSLRGQLTNSHVRVFLLGNTLCTVVYLAADGVPFAFDTSMSQEVCTGLTKFGQVIFTGAYLFVY